MKAETLTSKPVWQEAARPRFAPLQADAGFDVAIIGGGITGLTAAYLLKLAGKRVAVFEKERIAGGDTGHTTAHLTYVTDKRLSQLASDFSREEAHLVWHGGETAMQTIEAIVAREEIDCQFRHLPGFLHAAITKQTDEAEELQQEADFVAELGFSADYVPRVPVFDRPGIRFANQAIFHPVKYLAKLAERIQGDGCEIYEESKMTAAQEDPLSIEVNGHSVTCDSLILGTHVPLLGINGIVAGTLFQTKLAGYSTYAIGATLPPGEVPQASFWDTDDPYYYLRVEPHADGAYAIFGGEDHKTGQHSDPESRYAQLESVLLEFLPQARVDHRWSGQVIETIDGLPYIGPVNEQQFIATGFSGNGMTFGTLGGMMACDWVLDRANPWQDLFDVERKSLRGGAWDYLKENTSFPYHLVKGYVSSVSGGGNDELAPGEGRVLKIDGQRCAVSCNEQGELTACSAICTHMGCVVRWNGAEKTWDCPCHGSRFTTEGEVIAGPAETPLEHREVKSPSST